MTTDDSFLDDHTFLGDGHPDTLDQRLARELPDDVNDTPFERQPDAVGELVAEPHDGEDEGIAEEQDVLAQQAGPAREDAPAEQAAMHIVDPDAETEEDYSAFVSDVEEETADHENYEVAEDAEDGERDDSSDEFVFDSELDDDSASRYGAE